jgi:hypothetical protein
MLTCSCRGVQAALKEPYKQRMKIQKHGEVHIPLHALIGKGPLIFMR